MSSGMSFMSSQTKRKTNIKEREKEINMATFKAGGDYQFTFINHSNRPIRYEIGPATGGQYNRINGDVNPGQRVDSESFGVAATLEQGNVRVITIADAPTPGFRFWSGGVIVTDQYINVLAGEGYTVTKDSSEISEVTGNGFRVTVDGGGENNPRVGDIYIQVYNA
ncbi:hypothetical protein LC574_01080 [Nostoc sp. CHAB 5715]|nr:hypothetical protein [Nostoc sp. CHAB 5715]